MNTEPTPQAYQEPAAAQEQNEADSMVKLPLLSTALLAQPQALSTATAAAPQQHNAMGIPAQSNGAAAGSGSASASKNRLITDYLAAKPVGGGQPASTPYQEGATSSQVRQPVFENANLVTGSSLLKVSEFSASPSVH